MPLDPARLLSHDFGEVRQNYTARDAILYALGVGLGENPLDDDDLVFLDETRLRVLPTFGVTLGSPGMWLREPAFGVDFTKLVHSAQHATFHACLPPDGEIVSTARVASLEDRGHGRGAVLTVERRIANAVTGDLHCLVTQTLLLRGDGGFGGQRADATRVAMPDRAPDAHISVPTSPRAALIYRLSGDWNPLHIDPAFARRAGFPRPIMHGLGTYATVGIALARELGVHPDAVSMLGCRFTGVVYPGDLLRIELWRDDAGAHFRAHVDERPVLDGGRIAVTARSLP